MPVQVVPDLGLLFTCLGEEPLRHDIGHVLADNAHLLKTVFDAAQVIGDELELGVIKEALLQPGDKPEANQPADLSDLS